MVSWSDFSIETRHRILYHFCVDTIKTYQPDSFGQDPEWATSIEWADSNDWPRSPQCLRDFTSALLTCRDFNKIITNKIKYRAKVTGRGKIKYRTESPVDTLRSMQYEMLDDIVDGLCDDCLERGSVEEMFGVVGCFWKNKKVFEDKSCIGRVLKETFGCGLRALVPHLQAWVLQHAERDMELDNYDSAVNGIGEYETLEFDFCKPGRSRWTQCSMSFKKGSIKVSSSRTHVCSIAGIITKEELKRHIGANETPEPEDDDKSEYSDPDDDSEDTEEDDPDRMYPCDPSVPLVWEILASSPGSWWVFIVPVFNDPCEWVFVNYADKKMFVAPDPTTMYRWTNPWDVSGSRKISASGCPTDSDDSDGQPCSSEYDSEDDRFVSQIRGRS